MINLNLLAQKIAHREGLKKQVNIAQIKEVIRAAFIELKEESFADVAQVITKQK